MVAFVDNSMSNILIGLTDYLTLEKTEVKVATRPINDNIILLGNWSLKDDSSLNNVMKSFIYMLNVGCT